jgi:hypothetical protein
VVSFSHAHSRQVRGEGADGVCPTSKAIDWIIVVPSFYGFGYDYMNDTTMSVTCASGKNLTLKMI